MAVFYYRKPRTIECESVAIESLPCRRKPFNVFRSVSLRLVGAAAGLIKGLLLGDSTPDAVSVAVNSDLTPVSVAFDAAAGNGAVQLAAVGETELQLTPVNVYVAAGLPVGVTYSLYESDTAADALATSLISHST